MNMLNVRTKLIVVSVASIVFAALLGCSSAPAQTPSEAANPTNTAAPQAPNNAPTTVSSQPANTAVAQPTMPPNATPINVYSNPSATTTGVVQTPMVLATATKTPVLVPTATPLPLSGGVTRTPTRTPTPTPVITGYAIQDQISEQAFRTLMNAYDSGQIRQETNCLPVPEINELNAEVLRSTRDDVDSETYLLENIPLPFILLLDIQNVQPGGYFDSVYLFPRSDELPGISSDREVLALVNVCPNAKIPTNLRIEAEDMRWTLYVLTRS